VSIAGCGEEEGRELRVRGEFLSLLIFCFIPGFFPMLLKCCYFSQLCFVSLLTVLQQFIVISCGLVWFGVIDTFVVVWETALHAAFRQITLASVWLGHLGSLKAWRGCGGKAASHAAFAHITFALMGLGLPFIFGTVTVMWSNVAGL
jgi:hypothetical protein